MDRIIKVAVDAMGGDNAPEQVVKGAVEAVAAEPRVKIYLCGKEPLIREELAKYSYDQDRIEIVHCSEVIETAEPPVNAVRKKKDSSLVKAMYLVKDGECDALVTAGSTGAFLVGGQVIVGRIRGIERPPLATVIPTTKGISFLLDCGANVDAKPTAIVQFAQMGAIYAEDFLGIKNPTVGIVNIGAEEEKGNALVKETFPLLKEAKGINFIGSCEARDVPLGGADVVVAEAFTGNVVLKMMEGMAGALIKMIKKGLTSTFISKIGALLSKKALKKTLKTFDTESYGGAPLLGCNGLLVKTHGSSSSVAIRNSIFQCVKFTDLDINGKIKARLLADESKEEASDNQSI